MGKAKQSLRRAAKVAGSPVLKYVNRQFERMDQQWQDRMARLEHRLLGDLEANAELTATHARVLHQLNDKLDRLADDMVDADIRRAIGRPIEQFTPDAAHFANWIIGFKGPMAQKHVWINHGLH